MKQKERMDKKVKQERTEPDHHRKIIIKGMEALQMLVGGFVIFMIPQVVGSVAVFLELVAATIRQVWYI